MITDSIILGQRLMFTAEHVDWLVGAWRAQHSELMTLVAYFDNDETLVATVEPAHFPTADDPVFQMGPVSFVMPWDAALVRYTVSNDAGTELYEWTERDREPFSRGERLAFDRIEVRFPMETA